MSHLQIPLYQSKNCDKIKPFKNQGELGRPVLKAVSTKLLSSYFPVTWSQYRGSFNILSLDGSHTYGSLGFSASMKLPERNGVAIFSHTQQTSLF